MQTILYTYISKLTFHFKSVLGVDHKPYIKANWFMLYSEPGIELANLKNPFNKEKMKLAVFSLGLDKSLGLNGFIPLMFLQKVLSDVKMCRHVSHEPTT